ncbi:MAG: hypothetical protein V4628_06215 [Pseudomonadota bacterium]
MIFSNKYFIKILTHCLLAITLIVAAAGISAAEESSAADRRAAVAAYFEGADEPTVEAAAWTSASEFNVGIHDMGATENSFARYVCSVLDKRGLPANTTVNVIDINTMGVDRKKWEVIGKADCRE